jgi:hypothetical protein
VRFSVFELSAGDSSPTLKIERRVIMATKMVRKREYIKDSSFMITLPKEFEHQQVEIIIIPLKEKKRKFRSVDIISVNTKGIRFDREERHSR